MTKVDDARLFGDSSGLLVSGFLRAPIARKCRDSWFPFLPVGCSEWEPELVTLVTSFPGSRANKSRFEAKEKLVVIFLLGGKIVKVE
jgi:hypothetical protein